MSYADPAPEIKRHYTEDERVYELPRALIPAHMLVNQPEQESYYFYSVTSILHETRPPNKILDEFKAEQMVALGIDGARLALALSAIYGTQVHGAIDEWIAGKKPLTRFGEGGRPLYNDFEWARIWRFMKFMDFYRPQFESTEQKVFSMKYEIAGTYDALGIINGKRYMMDWKTSKDIFEDYPLQAAAYYVAFKEMHPEVQIDGLLILSLRNKSKEGWKAAIFAEEEVADLFDDFDLRRRMFRKKHPGPIEPKRDLIPVEFPAYQSAA